jgi:type III secretory pathway component EscT
MKALITSALVATAALSAGAASAMTPSNAELHVIQNYAPQAVLSQLSDAEVNTLLSFIYSGDSEGEKQLRVKHLVNKFAG